MRNTIYLLILSLFFVSCKPTSSIITSKNEAEKRGIYKAPSSKIASRTTSGSVLNSASPATITYAPPAEKKEVVSKPAVAAKKINKKTIINDRNDDDYIIASDNESYVVKQLINTAESNLGANYHTGGTNPNSGFDCSGLMFSTFKQFDISLPRSSNDMAKVGRKLDDNEIQQGDLIFFKTNGRSVINHVGMVTEVSDDEIKFIHSSTQKGVIISSTKEPYYNKTFAQANRIIVN